MVNGRFIIKLFFDLDGVSTAQSGADGFVCVCVKMEKNLWSFCSFELDLPDFVHWFTQVKVQSGKNKGHNPWGTAWVTLVVYFNL